jgi:uncharacterized NAD-dependent epimerase/dehydratase family protein
VLCHDPQRTHVNSLRDFQLPSLDVAASAYIDAARLTNPAVRLVGVSLITEGMDDAQRARVLDAAQRQLGVPAFDPLKTTLDPVIDRLLAP